MNPAMHEESVSPAAIVRSEIDRMSRQVPWALAVLGLTLGALAWWGQLSRVSLLVGAVTGVAAFALSLVFWCRLKPGANVLIGMLLVLPIGLARNWDAPDATLPNLQVGSMAVLVLHLLLFLAQPWLRRIGAGR